MKNEFHALYGDPPPGSIELSTQVETRAVDVADTFIVRTPSTRMKYVSRELLAVTRTPLAVSDGVLLHGPVTAFAPSTYSHTTVVVTAIWFRFATVWTSVTGLTLRTRSEAPVSAAA